MTSKGTDLTLGDIMSQDVVIVSPETTLRDVLELLVGRGISGVPVAVRDKVVGVISARDLLEFEASNPGVPIGRPDPMDEEETTPEWQDAQGTSTHYFWKMWDNSGADVLERFESSDSPEWDALEEHTVAEVMTRAVYALPPDAAVSKGARYMLSTGIHRVLVMTEDRLLGLVTTTDIVRAVAEERI